MTAPAPQLRPFCTRVSTRTELLLGLKLPACCLLNPRPQEATSQTVGSCAVVHWKMLRCAALLACSHDRQVVSSAKYRQRAEVRNESEGESVPMSAVAGRSSELGEQLQVIELK